MSEKCEHKWKYYCLSKVIHCELCETDALKYIKQIEKQNSELQAKCDELEDALRLNKAEQDVYSEAIREFDEIDKKNQVMREALEKIINLKRVVIYRSFEIALQALKDIE